MCDEDREDAADQDVEADVDPFEDVHKECDEARKHPLFIF